MRIVRGALGLGFLLALLMTFVSCETSESGDAKAASEVEATANKPTPTQVPIPRPEPVSTATPEPRTAATPEPASIGTPEGRRIQALIRAAGHRGGDPAERTP